MPGLLEQASQSPPHDAVIVSQQHAQAVPPSMRTGSGSSILIVVPVPAAPLIVDGAAKFLDALFDAPQAQAVAASRGVETDAVIASPTHPGDRHGR